MKIINTKRITPFAIFLTLSGLGALWLTYWWMRTTASENPLDGLDVYILRYYIFNSILLVFLGGILQAKKSRSLIYLL
jgi:hypothetical protein